MHNCHSAYRVVTHIASRLVFLCVSVPLWFKGISVKRLLNAALVLAFVVVSLGAYVRLSDAGLGCPDWPGCYGHLVGIPDADHEHAAAAAAFPGKPVEAAKAWKEMIHRYAAGSLGLLILAIAALAWRREQRQQHSPALPTLLLGLVMFQALLGMWTVTLLLKPLVVTAHLLGGMSTLALLLWLRLGLEYPKPAISALSASPTLRLLGIVALAAVALQIGLGGWVSSNYAALACPDFPACRDGQWQPVDVPSAIHLAHRGGALLVALVVGAFAVALLRHRAPALLLAAALTLQLSLGIANVLLQLPLLLAVAHNSGAALLLTAVVFANARCRRPAWSISRAMPVGQGRTPAEAGPGIALG